MMPATTRKTSRCWNVTACTARAELVPRRTLNAYRDLRSAGAHSMPHSHGDALIHPAYAAVPCGCAVPTIPT